MTRKYLMICFMCMPLAAMSQRSLSLEEFRQLAITHNHSIKIADESMKAATEMKKAAYTQFLPNFTAFGNYTWNEKNISLLSQDAHLPVGVLDKSGNFGIGTPTSLPKPNGDGTFSMDGLAINNKFAIVNKQPVPLDAEGKPFDPKVNPEKLMWKNYAILPKDAMQMDMQNIFVGGISFVQPIFMGGKIAQLYNIAKSGERIAEIRHQDKIEELLINVDEAYWRVVSVENKYKLAKEYRALIAKLDTNMQEMLKEGVATKAEALKVKVKLNEADMSLTKAENGLQLSRMALNQLCGISLHEKVELKDVNLNPLTEIQPVVAMDEVYKNRAEIQQLAETQKIADANHKIMFARFLPNVALTGSYIVSNPNSYNGFEKKFGGMFTFGVSAIVPIFHFGEKIHTYNASKSFALISKMEMEEAKEKIELQVNQNAYRIQESIKKQAATQKNIEQAEENLSYANEGFREGVITSSDLLAAQTAWLSAKSENIDALIDVKLNNTYLKKSLGVLHQAK